MRFRSIAFVALVAVLAFAPQAFAWSSGGHGGDGGAESASFNRACSAGNNCSDTFGNGRGGGTGKISTSEPLATLLVGLGLLGARFLRRR